MCQCQENLEETGRLEIVESITAIAASNPLTAANNGRLRVTITCIHGESWDVLLLSGDPLWRLLAQMRSEMYTAA
jgi:hypothetical protein